MKKFYVILAAVAGITLTSCTSSDYLGEVDPVANQYDGSIRFSSGLKGMTRAEFVGADAAEKLNNHFVVYGAKNTTETADGTFADTKVFDHYNVAWTANSAGTTTSNTSDWEYVGLAKHHNASADIAASQTIKYWDFSTAQYDFIAYSTGNKTEVFDATDLTAGSLVVTPITPATAATNAYTVTGLSADDFSGFYVANMKTVEEANYKEEVSLTFRNITTKVRMALYETVPGYSVKDVKFYTAADDASPSPTATLYAGANAFNEKGTFTVKYPTIGNPSTNGSKSDFNQAHIDFAAYTDGTGTATKKQFSPLSNLAPAEINETAGNLYLGRTASTASYTHKDAADDKGYKYVLPNEEGVVLNLKCDYTLVSTDGSGETIKVTGATAQVPQIYAMWKSGFAYTYIFKISKNTNGTTGTGSDPVGLYPITFDAVVLNDEVDGNQETITTVATPSITTYQKNTNGQDEYVAGDIYAMVQEGADLKEDIDPNGKFYSINTTGMNPHTILSETAVSDALNIGCVEYPAGTFKGRNGIKLTSVTTDYVTAVPGEDGNDMKAVEEVTVAASTVLAPDNAAIASYYTDEACTTPATITSNKTGEYLTAGTYYRKTAAKVNASATTTYAFVYKVSDTGDTQLKTAVVPAINTPLLYYKTSDNTQLEDYVAEGTTDEVYYIDNVVVADAAALTGYFHDAALTKAADKGDGTKTFYKKPTASVAVVAGTDPAHYYTDATLTTPASANGLAAGTYWKKVSTDFADGASVPAGYYTTNTFATPAPSTATGAQTYWKKVSETVAAGTDPTGYWTTSAYDVAATATVLKAAAAGTYYHSETEAVADGTSLSGYFHDVDCTKDATKGDGNAEYFTKVTVTPSAGDVLKKFYTDNNCTVQVTYGKANGTTTYYQKVNNANTTYAVKVIKVQ
ncbi:MAG: hypothetical protein K6G92_02855 [Bacteroidaceae bacterium]|nr:hypothetical protein [Bacteroidaceae bacterium]